MHMADALLSPAVAATMYVTSGITTGISGRKLMKDDMAERLPMMAVTSAMVFAGQMVNYTIPGTGSSGHICGGMLLSAIMGPFAGFLSMVVILAIQCLFFADGGLMALGANCWNMAFYGCFVGYFLIWRPIIQGKLFGGNASKKAMQIKIALAAVLGCIITLQLGAFSVVLETSISGITDLPFGAFIALMQPIHLAIGLVEGLVTAAVLLYLYNVRPALLQDVVASENAEKNSKQTLKSVVIVLAVVSLVIGAFVSLLASSNPDGLEWSLFGNAEAGYSSNMGLDEEDYGITGDIYEKSAAIQENTAFLPDYAFPDSESSIGTSVSGVVGSVMVGAVAVGIAFLGKALRKKKE